MKCENKVRLMYRTSGGACFAILNEPYRLDGSLIVEGDSVASVTESAMRADKWVTINGAHVLIGKGNTVIAGMGNKFNGRRLGRLSNSFRGRRVKLDKALYNRKILGEIAEKCKRFKQSAEYGNMQLGIRIQEKDTERIGGTMKHRSKNFGDDFETKEELKHRNGEQLNGVSTVDINFTHEVPYYGGYEGRIVYLVAGEKSTAGYDAGEMVIQKPKVLAKFGIKNGELVELGAVKVTKRKKAKENKPTKPSEEYTNFIKDMENKYGKDGMYGKMTDAEFDKYQELENHKYDYFYKQ